MMNSKPEYEIKQEGQVFKCGRTIENGKVLVNAIQLPADTTLTMEDVEPVLSEMNRQLLIQYLAKPQMDA